MEHFDLLNNELQVTPPVQSYLTEAAKWGKFLAIVGFIFCGLTVLSSLFMPSYINSAQQYNSLSPAALSTLKVSMTLLFLLSGVLLFFPCLYLFRFSVKMQQAMSGVSQENFEESTKNLKSMFKFYAILVIVTLSLYAILIIVGLLAAAMR